MLKPRKHKVAKKETLETIAKKYGFKDPKQIWKYPKNKSLVAKLKDPKQLHENDILMIPAMNEKQREEFRAKDRELNMAISFDKYAAQKFTDEAKRGLEAADKADELAKDADQSFKQFQAELRESANNAKNWSDGVDMAAAVIGILRSLGSLAKKSKEASEHIANKMMTKFDKVYDEMLKESGQFVLSPGLSEGQKAFGKFFADTSKPTNDVFLAIGVTVESYGKLTSPSFWGKAIIAMKDGKNWSDAATYDYQAEVKIKLTEMEADRKRIVDTYNKRAAKARTYAKKCEKEAASVEKRIKGFRKQKDLLDKEVGS